MTTIQAPCLPTYLYLSIYLYVGQDDDREEEARALIEKQGGFIEPWKVQR